MRIDIVSLFPEMFAGPLGHSIIKRAIDAGRLSVGVTNPRDFAFDKHRIVDDYPFGGGSGMVMKPEPWGEALDALLASYGPITDGPRPVLLVPTPSGRPFTQAMADELAAAPRIAFACGRYEGIDHRVIDWARQYFDVSEVSLGDYVLNGGEVAALAMIEATVRLVPGVIGNSLSLVEESYSAASDHLLEYPVYTKPASWRGFDVPEVLLSGHHGKVAQWRHEQSVEITSRRRPDLIT